MYDPFAPPPAPGTVAITSAPVPPPTAPTMAPAAPAASPVANPASPAAPSPNNALAGMYPGFGAGMGHPFGFGRGPMMRRMFGPMGMMGGFGRIPGFDMQGFQDAYTDWRSGRPVEATRGSDAWGDWKAQMPNPMSYWGQAATPTTPAVG